MNTRTTIPVPRPEPLPGYKLLAVMMRRLAADLEMGQCGTSLTRTDADRLMLSLRSILEGK